MVFARGHLIVVGAVLFMLAATGSALAVAREANRPTAVRPPIHGLAYTTAKYSLAATERAFATEGIRLHVRSHSAAITTLGDATNHLEIDVFADRATVERSGFYDYMFVRGRYVRFPSTCSATSMDAERWRGNVRAIVSCGTGMTASSAALRQAAAAFKHL